MTKAHLVVLGFLNAKPMYGYKIGQIVSESPLSIWAGIKLPSVYKAMQILEEKNYCIGEEVSEGNNPPRTVYSITPKGKQYLHQMLIEAMTPELMTPHDFWMALSFANHVFHKEELLNIVNAYIRHLEEVPQAMKQKRCTGHFAECEIPFAHDLLMDLGEGIREVQLKTLATLKTNIQLDKYKDFLLDKESEIE